MPHTDTRVEILAQNQSSDELTRKHITSSVRVYDLIVGQFGDWVNLRVAFAGLDVAWGR
jgi:hypothetical protein